MYYIYASLALFFTVSTAAANSNNMIDINPDEKPEVAIETLCAAFPDLKSCQQSKSLFLEFRQPTKHFRLKTNFIFHFRLFKLKKKLFSVEPMEKRKSAYMRFGRSSPSEFEEMPMNEMEKRKSAYMR